MEAHPLFKAGVKWFMERHPDLSRNIAFNEEEKEGDKLLLTVLSKDRLIGILKYMLDENEFLSSYGIRSLSKHHEKNPYMLKIDGKSYAISYEPGESAEKVYGGNSI